MLFGHRSSRLRKTEHVDPGGLSREHSAHSSTEARNIPGARFARPDEEPFFHFQALQFPGICSF